MHSYVIHVYYMLIYLFIVIYTYMCVYIYIRILAYICIYIHTVIYSGKSLSPLTPPPWGQPRMLHAQVHPSGDSGALSVYLYIVYSSQSSQVFSLVAQRQHFPHSVLHLTVGFPSHNNLPWQSTCNPSPYLSKETISLRLRGHTASKLPLLHLQDTHSGTFQ